MKRREKDREGGVTFLKGVHRAYHIKILEFVVWNKKSMKELKKTNPQIIGAWTMRRMVDIFNFESNSIDEYQILENMGNLFF